MPRKKRIKSESKLNYNDMNTDLKFACWDLQYEMLIASKRMEIDDLWVGKTKDYIEGFRAGWEYREAIVIGRAQICQEILGKD